MSSSISVSINSFFINPFEFNCFPNLVQKREKKKLNRGKRETSKLNFVRKLQEKIVNQEWAGE